MGLAAPWSGEPSWPRVEPTSPALAGDLFTAGPLGKPWLWFWDASPWQLMMLHLFPCVLAVPHPLHTSGSAIVKVTANSLLLSVSGLPSTLSSGPVVLKWTMLWWLLLDHFSSDLIHGLLTSASCCLLPFPHGYLKGISDLTCCKQNSCWFFFFFLFSHPNPFLSWLFCMNEWHPHHPPSSPSVKSFRIHPATHHRHCLGYCTSSSLVPC